MVSVACALFVKNEHTDIAGWVAWHLALGVDHLFIYEDHSTDGTWEILQALARVAPITLLRTDPKAQPNFYWRQRDAYMDAAKRARGFYDWLGFLDGDEYVYLCHHDTMSGFLEQFPEAWGVALNWRIHGSGSRVVRPREVAVEAFLWHSSHTLDDNTLVKSFVRPDRLGTHYTDPHRYNIPEEHYVDARGERVAWHGATKVVDWRDAFVLHYICRSMEHYIERIRRRMNADLSDSTAHWEHFNRNDAEDHAPLRFMPKVHLILGRLHTAMLDAASHTLWSVSRAMQDIPLLAAAMREDETLATPDIAHDRAHDVRTVILRTHFDTVLTVGPDRIVTHVAMDALDGTVPLLGAIHASTPDDICLFAVDRGAFTLRTDTRHLAEAVFHILPSDRPGTVYLRSAHAGRYISVAPPDIGTGVVADRQQANPWEEFTLVDVQATTTLGLTPLPTVDHAITVRALCEWIKTLDTPPRRSDLLRAFARMPPVERVRLGHLVPGLVTPFV